MHDNAQWCEGDSIIGTALLTMLYGVSVSQNAQKVDDSLDLTYFCTHENDRVSQNKWQFVCF